MRSGSVAVYNDVNILGIDGIPETITNVIHMPRPEVMQRIMDALLE